VISRKDLFVRKISIVYIVEHYSGNGNMSMQQTYLNMEEKQT